MLPMPDTAKQKPHSKRRWLIDIALMLLAIALFSYWQNRELVTGEAPDFRAVDLAGQEQSLRDFIAANEGKPVLLHFWASWCGICKMVDGSVNAISESWPVLSIAYQSGNSDAVKSHMQREGLSFPVVIDEDGAIAQRYNIRGVPTSYILNAKGDIQYRSVGYTSGIGLRIRLWLASRT